MKFMLRFCSVFNILVGLIAVLFCIGLSMLAIGLGGGLSLDSLLQASLMMGPMGIAGILYAWSGVVLWKSLPSVRKKAVILTGTAWLFCLVYCLRWFSMLHGSFGVAGQTRQPGAPYDEEVVMFVFIPTAMLFLIAIEVVFLWRTVMHRKGQQAGIGQPATSPESKSEGSGKPQPEAERRSR
jgi:hypothetical protein